MKNRYSVLESADWQRKKSLPIDGMYRGFYPIYDALLEHVQPHVKNACEIGIGYAQCHIVWNLIFNPEANVIGLDIGSPIAEHEGNQGDTLRNKINIKGLDTYIRYPMSFTRGLNLHWNKDGYDPDVVKEAVDAYGKFDWVVNDALQRGEAFKMMTSWKDAITETGIIFQEKIGREPESKINQQRMQQALDEGWLIYDVRQYADLDTDDLAGNADAEGYIGIWSNNQDNIINMLKEYEHLRLKDTSHIDPAIHRNEFRQTLWD